MKLKLIVVLFFFFTGFYAQNNMVFLTYNIKLDYPKDGENSWTNRKHFMVRQLQFYEPDIFGVQEAMPNQMKDLDSLLTDYNFVGVGRDDGNNQGEYSAIFYKSNQFKVLNTSTFWLSETPKKVSMGWDAVCNRVCSYALFENKNTNKQFYVFNTHFDHIGIEAREKSADLIISMVNKLTKPEDYIILTGDFNLSDNSRPIINLQNNFNDTNKSLKKNDSSYGTFNSFKLNFVSENRIDYVFEKNFKLIDSRHILVKTPSGRWASDHHPVLAKLKL